MKQKSVDCRTESVQRRAPLGVFWISYISGFQHYTKPKHEVDRELPGICVLTGITAISCGNRNRNLVVIYTGHSPLPFRAEWAAAFH